MVLHALRGRLTVDEAAQLGAQLPMLVRGIYYDGWNPSKVPEKMNREEFLQRIRQEYRFDVEGGVERLARTVLQAIKEHVSEGEWQDVKSSVGKDLAPLLP